MKDWYFVLTFNSLLSILWFIHSFILTMYTVQAWTRIKNNPTSFCTLWPSSERWWFSVDKAFFIRTEEECIVIVIIDRKGKSFRVEDGQNTTPIWLVSSSKATYISELNHNKQPIYLCINHKGTTEMIWNKENLNIILKPCFAPPPFLYSAVCCFVPAFSVKGRSCYLSNQICIRDSTARIFTRDFPIRLPYGVTA